MSLCCVEGYLMYCVGHCLGIAPGPPQPVPILPRDRTNIDKVNDYYYSYYVIIF